MHTLNRREFLAANLASWLSLRMGFPVSTAFADMVETQQAQQAAGTKEVKTGGVRMIQVDGKYKVWTKRVGSGPIAMLTLHGGPGTTHEYFECFEDFLPQQGIQFFTTTSLVPPTPTSRTIPVYGRLNGFERKSSKSGPHWGWRIFICTGNRGVAC